MPGKFHHEELYRGTELLQRLSNLQVTLCGVGALGSHLADHLTRQGVSRLKVIDHDRIEEHNVSTQLYGESDVGGWKVDVLKNQLFRAAGIEIDAVRKELTKKTVRKFLKGSGLVIDTFDNSASRKLVADFCTDNNIPCLHVGLFEDYAETIWNEGYRVPDDQTGDVCDYPLARNLVMFAVVLASETLFTWLQENVMLNRSITLRDFNVQPLEVPA